MQKNNLVKATVFAIATLWFAGCASQKSSTSSVTENQPDGTVNSGQIEVQPILDPSVQAVIDSGKIDASPEQIESLLKKDTFFFPFDSTALDDESYMSLEVYAAFFTSPFGESKKILIHGHTDERGTRTYNLALGERRANVIRDYLVVKGVASDRIEVISYGFEKPLNPEHNKAAWDLNRRAVIIVKS